MQRLLRVIATVTLVTSGACVHIYPTESGMRPSEPPTEPASEKSKDAEEDAPFEPWDEALEDTRAVDGLFTVHIGRDRSLYLELPPDRLGEAFGMVLHISRGVGDLNIQQGLPLSGMQLVRFRRVGDAVRLVRENPRFVADPGSALEAAMERNVGHAAVASFDIESEHERTGHLLLDVTDFFVSDYAGLRESISFFYGNKPANLDEDRSHIGRVLGFPRNVEIDAELTFAATGAPIFGGAGLADRRTVPIGVRYSLIALPESPMRPRYADDRVGYFLTARWDYSRDRQESSFQRYVNRWRLEKANPSAERSEPAEPIVYYIDHSVPRRYRTYVKEGIEAWNRAFEAAGFENAIIARPAPDDSAWSAEDARYSTVRWTASHSMGYAIGPSQVDPRTGEILNADILIAATWPRAWLRDWQERADPRERIDRFRRLHRRPADAPGPIADGACFAQMGKAHELAMQYDYLTGLGVLEPGEPMPEKFIGAAIRDLVMHEVGHTLGLRHNFKGSSGVPNERLHDTAFTGRTGVGVSVMDYNPVNVARDPDAQGHYWNPGVGTYDVWAIQYGYAPIYEQRPDAPFAFSGELAASPEAERVGLRKIARQGADPLHTYNTDEDNWLGSFAVDPLTNAYDLGSDPIRYAADRIALVEEVRPRLEERLIQEGEGYPRLRRAFSNMIFERFRVLLPVTKTVGGLHFVRHHKGDPEARSPFTPVPAERQREAVRLIIDRAFAPDAFHFDAGLLNKLAPSRWAHWGESWFQRPVDVPVHDYVASVQHALLDELLAPARLTRMIDNAVRMPGAAEPYRIGELMDTLHHAIWSEITGEPPRSIGSFRRNLQRIHIEEMTQLLLDARSPWQVAATPEDARSLARLHLTRLAGRIEAVLAAPDGTLDRATRAHLAESKARIDRTLDAAITITAGFGIRDSGFREGG